MATLLQTETKPNVLQSPVHIVNIYLSDPERGREAEEILAQFGPSPLADSPGHVSGHEIEHCRTIVCNCTRAVPHGSYL